ncbi:hypothetical protein GW750_07375 [bacterium]|nr:hypothetical protein [bacterium]
MSISPRTYLPQLKTIRTFQSTIFSRYEEYQRSFPRREEPTPYNVFLSEIMSQQTQVARVVPKFLTFKKKVPDFVSLSQLDNKTLLSLRSGL